MSRALGAVGEGLVEFRVGPDRDHVGLGFGGDAANVCVMAARLGTPARLAGRVGADVLGARLISFWSDAGVDVTFVERDADASTGLYLNESLGDGEHRFVYWRAGSAGSRFAPKDLQERFFADLGLLVVTGVTLAVSESSARAVTRAVDVARACGARVACVLNHRPALGGDVQRLAAIAAASDVVIGSRDEALHVLGFERPVGPGWRAIELVVTDGARGATLFFAGATTQQSAPPMTASNAAGAGDALAGAYLGMRLLGRSPAECLAWGVAAAALSVRQDGCAASYPSAGETHAFLHRLPGANASGPRP